MSLVTLVACHNAYNPGLAQYLKAERELRRRVSAEQGLEDSLSVLRKKFQINVEKELAKIKNDPEAWLKLLKELQDGKK